MPGQFSIALQDSTPGPQLTASLSNWKSVVSMMFSNSSALNLEAIKTYSSLLLKSGDVDAAHICFLLFSCGTFGPPTDSQSSFELLGSDKSSEAGFGRDTDSILLSLALEFYKISTEPTLPTIPYYPHMVLYKLNMTSYLADLGSIAEAQSLFDSISNIVKAAGKNINYSPAVFNFMDFVGQRLSLTYQDDSTTSWLSAKLGRPKFDKVLGQLDKSFSKFVTGGDDDAHAVPSKEPNGNGIFKRLADTPSVSRVQSTVDLAGVGGVNNLASTRSASYGGNPYAPIEADLSRKDAGFQLQQIPSRTNSSIGFNGASDNGLLSPPQPVRSAGDSRPLSPLYGLGKGHPANSLQSTVSLTGELSNPRYPPDMSRPKSASTNRSRRSSLNSNSIQENSPYGNSGESYATAPLARSYTNLARYIPEEHLPGRSNSAVGGSPLKNQFPQSATTNSYHPSVASTTKPANPYSLLSQNSHTASGYNQYAPSQNSLPSISHEYPANNATSSSQNGRHTPVVTPTSNSFLSPKYATSLSRPSSRISHVPSPTIEEHSQLKHPSQVASVDKSRTSSVSVAPYNPYTPVDDGTLNPYASQPTSPKHLRSGASNPYAPSNAASKPIGNPYAPVSTTEPLQPPAPVIVANRAESPSYGGYDPYASMYDPSGLASKTSLPVQDASTETIPDDTESENVVKESQDDYEPYEAPSYGFRNDDTSSEPIGDDIQPTGEIFAPMHAPTFNPSQYPTNDNAQPERLQSNTVVEEDEEIEDLGFANSSSKPKKDVGDTAKEEAVKAKEKEKEKKSGWFSWIRKGSEDGDKDKAVQIKFGESMSLVYDPELKRYVNKNAPKEDLKPAPKLAPPPPGGTRQSLSNGPPPSYPSSTFSPPPMMPNRSASVQPPPSMVLAPSPGGSPRSARNTPAPPSSGGGGLDDLLAAAPSAGGRKSNRRNARARYVDIMGQK